MPTMTEVNSSNIYAVGHDPDTNTLHVQFRSSKDKRMPGSSFAYQHVTAEQHHALMTAPSVGSHFSEHIKGHPERHPFKKEGLSLAVL
jgi:hypothetical protein